ncbi:phytanoyl-CoA dioxygenase family protein [Thalassomonas viridans]|uniref:Phytanoyl-CoA dioxygenase family protein n=1 Tax=Thalassomonas viridans TaxID=137584 RepID=A0AAE9ZAW5_9GAMM|nr:phytanoyl-CoA dioxygenase family protein [Thalassomonas viridans]WDE09262.1 phytanoyl-CoA dioxygenase family protein [Thalassomonas viridans]
MNIDFEQARTQYREKGFWQSDSIFDELRVEQINMAMDDVMDGLYDTGIQARDTAGPGFNAKDTIRDINMVHLANSDIAELVCDPALIDILAGLFDAKALQIWGSQLFHKPPALSRKCNIGWHQDFYFHGKFFAPESEIFTVWIAMSDVAENSGPVRMVPGSHKWGFYDIQSTPKEYVLQQLTAAQSRQWQEQPVVLAPGAFSVHHTLTYHGSYSNLSDQPRRCIALRMRTDKSTPCQGAKLDLKNTDAYPVVFGSEADLLY